MDKKLIEKKNGGLKNNKMYNFTNVLKKVTDPDAEWKDDLTQEYKKGGIKTGLAKGGKISGKGSAKSDSITKKVEDGSFIVPTENAGKFMPIGKSVLGWRDNEMANRSYPGTEVKLSNGEIIITPEEREILSYHGYGDDYLNSLAPQAEQPIIPGEKYKKGTTAEKTKEYVSALKTYSDQYRKSNPSANDTDIEKAYDEYLASLEDPQVSEYNTTKPQDEKSFYDKISEFTPEIAGTIQASIAGISMARAGRMPDLNVSASLDRLVSEQSKLAEYGLEPGVKASMLSEIEKSRNDISNSIVSGGGTPVDIQRRLQDVLKTTLSAKRNIPAMDAQEMARKQGLKYQTMLARAGQEMDVKKSSLSNWMALQELNAGLLSSGISNIIGARKLKNEMDFLRQTGTTDPLNSLIT